ncbi:MAG: retron St85 family RNA-directed DNA polymerase [Accumulibacter sp.]|jgi:RNA-directed DNA polymerase|uniref:retron St85 family RNA-directed DNA polymerase n=1 Tax=Accumulibacter sp. TaxID=2053492 RepID=UPI002FC33CC4
MSGGEVFSQADLLRRMSSELAMLPSHLARIIQTAPLRYKLFEIPKKSGGMREVAQPAREVKAIQRWIIREIGPSLPVHTCAMAYRDGLSILQNAEAHAASRFMLKLDFTNFFPSILRSDLELHLERHCSGTLDAGARKLVAHVSCWARRRQPPLRLCIGAPSSPLMSNSILFEFDSRIADVCAQEDVVYTRYADDITISSRDRGKIDRYEEIVRSVIKNLQYPHLTLNETKTVRASRAGKRVVTGLVLTPEGQVSLGRDRKRLIRAMYHRSLSQQLSPKEAQELSGLLAFADSIEPGFSAKLFRTVGQ